MSRDLLELTPKGESASNKQFGEKVHDADTSSPFQQNLESSRTKKRGFLSKSTGFTDDGTWQQDGRTTVPPSSDVGPQIGTSCCLDASEEMDPIHLIPKEASPV